MNACISVAKYLFIYTACDIILLPLYYHAWLTHHGCLASGLSFSFRTQLLCGSIKLTPTWTVSLALSAYSLDSLERKLCRVQQRTCVAPPCTLVINAACGSCSNLA